MVSMLYIDDREDNKLIEKIKKENIICEVKRLDVSDYIFSKVCIERKTVQDFYGSTISGRLKEQVVNMLNNGFEQVIVAIIGDYEELFWKGVRSNQNVFYGMLSSLTIKYKVSIIHFKKEIQFIHYLKYCIEKEGEEIDFTKIKRLASKDNTNLSLVCSLPNMSQLKANRLLEKYNIKLVLQSKINNDWIQNKDEKFIDNLLEIQGIGKKGAVEIAKYFY